MKKQEKHLEESILAKNDEKQMIRIAEKFLIDILPEQDKVVVVVLK